MEKYSQTRVLDRPISIKDNVLWDLIVKMLSFDRKNRISASDALKHPFFTSDQAKAEITDEQKQLAQSALLAQRNGDKSITQFDINPSYIFTLNEAKRISRQENPEQEMIQINELIQQRQQQQNRYQSQQIAYQQQNIQQYQYTLQQSQNPFFQGANFFGNYNIFPQNIQPAQQIPFNIQPAQQIPSNILPPIIPPNFRPAHIPPNIQPAVPFSNPFLPSNPEQTKIPCEICDKLINSNQYENHLNEHQMKMNSIIERKKQQDQLIKVQDNITQREKEKDEPEPQIPCEICKQLIRFSKYQEHILIHQQEIKSADVFKPEQQSKYGLLSHHLSSSNKDIPKNPNLTQSPYSGIYNPKYLDYIISTLQQLFMHRQFRDSMLSWDGKLWGEKKPYTTTDIQPSIRPQRPTIAQYGERIQLPEEKLEVEQFNRAKADALKDANIRTTNQGTFEELKQLFIELQNNQNTTGIQGQDNQVPTLARFLDKYRDIAGQRINQNEQQDVKIFLMNLFDHLEIHLDCLNMHNFIRRYFRCFLSEQQICVNGHLVNNAQRSKIITVQKSGVSNLYEALGGMIRGVYAKDAICSECQKENKGNNILIKRTLLQTLPNTIIFNIARVDFDVKQGRAVKDKSKFTFPYGLNQKQRDGQRGRYLTEEDQLDDILDLTPFTREAVLKNEASVNSNQERYQLIKKKINNYRKDKDKESDIRNYPVKSTSYDNMGRGEQYYKFRLVGVVIHQGNAAGGHYYSYVRERNPPYRWIKFNDNKTHYVLFRNEQSEQSSSSLSNQDQYVQGSIPIFNNQYNLMEEEFFGGQIQQSNLDADLFGVQQYNQEFRREMMERQNSACLIIYERIQPIDDWAFELGLVPQNAQQQQTPQIQYPRNLQVEINQQPDPVIVRAQQQMLENQVQVQPKPKSPESQIYNQNQYLQSIPKPQSKSPASSPSIQSTSLSQSNSKGKIQMPPPPQPKNINQDIEQVMVYANHLLGKLDRGEIFVQKHIDWIFKFYPDKLPEYNQNNQRDQPIFLRELLNTIIHQTKSIEQIQKVSAKIPGIQVPSAGNPPPIQGSIQKGIPTPLSGASKAASNFDIQNKLLIQGKSSPAPPVQQAQQLPTKSKTEVIKIESIQAQPKKDNPANVAYQQGNAKKP